jgi:hypothetical protein
MKNWSSYGPSEAQSGSAPALSVQKAQKNAEDARKAGTPHIGASASGVRLGSHIPPAHDQQRLPDRDERTA